MPLCLNTSTTVQSLAGEPVFSLVIKNTLGHAKGIISLGCVTSNMIRCLPLILLNHSSGSVGSVYFFSTAVKVSAFKRNGKDIIPIAAAPAANDPMKRRRGLVVFLFSMF